jgi:Gpi18-like mannosyltransferase
MMNCFICQYKPYENENLGKWSKMSWKLKNTSIVMMNAENQKWKIGWFYLWIYYECNIFIFAILILESKIDKDLEISDDIRNW